MFLREKPTLKKQTRSISPERPSSPGASPSGVVPFDPKSAEDIAFHCRKYLTFKDLCATRAVSRSWSVLKNVPVESTVFICEDGDFAGLPNRDHPCFRACLREAELHDVNIEISELKDLIFLRDMLPSIRRLSMEIEIPFHHTENVVWTRGMFCHAENLEKLELQVYGFDVPIEIDFNQLPRLTHFHSNCQVQMLNYNQRSLVFFGYVVDYWDELCSWIAHHSTKVQVGRYEIKTTAWVTFMENWSKVPDISKKPLYLECTASGTHFCTCLKGGQMCVLYPALNLDQFENVYEGSFEDYACLFTYTLSQNPQIEFQFHESCNEHEKLSWIRIMNPIRENLGLPRLALP